MYLSGVIIALLILLQGKVLWADSKNDSACDGIFEFAQLSKAATNEAEFKTLLSAKIPGVRQQTVEFLRAEQEKIAVLSTTGDLNLSRKIKQLNERMDVTKPVSTQPLAAKGSSSLGNSHIASRQKMGKIENQTAHDLAGQGYEVQFFEDLPAARRIGLIKAENLSQTRTPDLTVNGRVFDIYTPQTHEIGGVVTGITKKIEHGQTHRIVVRSETDLLSSDRQINHLRDALHRENTDGLLEVLVVRDLKDGGKKIDRVFP